MEIIEQSFPIFQLPKEIREVIYNKLEQEDAMDFRLLNQQCRDDIDNLFDYTVHLDDNHQDILTVHRILELRVKTCEILYFVKAIHTSTIFKFPHLVQHLNIQTANITPWNFYRILTECSESLKTLTINLTIPILQHKLETNRVLNFKNLNNLKVLIDMGKVTNFDYLDQEILIFNRLVRDSLKPKLNTFSATLGYESSNPIRSKRLSLAILSVICVHSSTLESVDFNLKGLRGPDPQDFLVLYSDFEENTFKKLKYLKKISLSNTCRGLSLGLLEDLCTNQIQLEAIKFNLTRFEWDLITRIASKNFQTLVSIDVTLTVFTVLEKTKFFNIAILKKCEGLKKLRINRYKRSGQNDADYFIQDLIYLPKSIEWLSIQNFQILSEELNICCDNGIFSNLETVSLSGSGDSDLFGVDGTVIGKLVGLPKIYRVSVMDIKFSGRLLKMPKLYGNDHEGRFTEIVFGRDEIESGRWNVVVTPDDLYVHRLI